MAKQKNKFNNKKDRKDRADERQAAAEKLTPQRKINKVIKRNKEIGGESKRELERLRKN